MDYTPSGTDESSTGEGGFGELVDPSADGMLTGIDEFDSVVGIVADGVVGAAGGLVGTTLMALMLLVGESLGAVSRESFAQLVGTISLGAVCRSLGAPRHARQIP